MMRSRMGWLYTSGAILVVTFSMALAACGSGSSQSASTAAGTSSASNGSTGSSSGLTTVKVALPGALLDNAPLFLGIKKGFFAKQGLKITTTILPQGGPAVLPAVVSGKADIGTTTNASAVLAVVQHLPIMNIAPGDTGGTDAKKDSSVILALKSSGITSPAQLKGKTIGILSLKGIQELQADAVLSKAGVDPTSVKYLPIPPPEMETALRSKRVDAVVGLEPFQTQMMNDLDVNVVAAADVDTMPNMPIAVYIASKQFVTDHPDIVRKFQVSMKESSAYATAHPDQLRGIVPTYTKIPASVVGKLRLPTWATEQNPATIKQFVDLMKKFGLVKSAPSVDSFVTAFPLSK